MDQTSKIAVIIIGLLLVIGLGITLWEKAFDKFLKHYKLVEVRIHGEGVYWTVQRERKRSGWKVIYKSSDYELMKTTFKMVTEPTLFAKGAGKEEVVIEELILENT